MSGSSSTDSSSGDSRQQRLDRLLADYLRSIEAGQPLNRAALLAANSDLADELQSFFRNRDAIERIAEPLRGGHGSDDATVGLADAPPAIGRLIRYFGDYELIAEIARGGMGVVYRAKQLTLNRVVALKMILSGQLASTDDVRRFRQEAEAAGNLDHPSIVPIYEIGDYDGQHYFSMKLIEGQSLAQRLRSKELPLSIRQSVELIAKVAHAVHHAHQRGVLHRDIKPGNILLDSAVQPHVTDFGLAKRVEAESDLTHSGAIVGTPSYMAPEQASASKQLTTAVDVYSLGAVLFELITGRPPFKAESSVDTLMQVLSRAPESPRRINAKIDRDLDTICLKCLEKDPQRRYDSAAALAGDLDRWLRSEPIAARPVSGAERAWRWCRRNPALASLASLAVLALVVGTIISTLFAYEARRQAKQAEDNALLADKQAREANDQRKAAEASERDALQNLYISHVIQAGQHHNLNEIGSMVQALATAGPAQPGKPDFRGFEWNLLSRIAHGYEQSFSGHKQGATMLCYSPDGKYLATAGYQELFVWDVATGKPALQLTTETEGEKFGVEFMTFTPDSRQLAMVDGGTASMIVRGEDSLRGVRAFSLPDGKQIARFPGSELIAFSADGQLVATLVTQPPKKNADVDQPPSPESPPAKEDWRRVTVRKFPSGEVIREFPAHDQRINYIAFNPEATQLGVSGELDLSNSLWADEQQVGDGKGIWGRIWDVKSAAPLKAYRLHGTLQDGDEFIVPEWQRTVMHNKQLTTFAGDPGDPVGPQPGSWSSAKAPGGKSLAAYAVGRNIEIYNILRDQPLRVLTGSTGESIYLAFSPDGQHLGSVSYDSRGDHAVQIWNPNKEVEGPKISIPLTASSPLQILIGGKQNQMLIVEPLQKAGSLQQTWDLKTGKLLLDAAKIPFGDGVLLEASLSADGKRLHGIFKPNGAGLQFRTWSTETTKLLQTADLDEKEFGSVFVFSPDFQTAVTCRFDNDPKVHSNDCLVLWSLQNGKELRSWKTGTSFWPVPLQFSPDGKLLACRAVGDGITGFLVYDVTAGKLVHQLSADGLYWPEVSFSIDGRRLIAAGAAGLRMWDMSSSKLLQSFAIPNTFEGELRRDGPQALAAISHDGSRLATTNSVSGYQSSRVLLWDVASGQQLLNLPAPDGYFSLQFSADDRRLLFFGYEESSSYLRVWDGSEFQMPAMGAH